MEDQNNVPKQSKTNWVALVILSLVVIGVGVGVWWWQNNKVVSPATDFILPTPSVAVTPTEATKNSEIVSIDTTWNKYINYTLGFSIKIPKNVSIITCKTGKTVEESEFASVPVKIFEKGSKFYIGPEYCYASLSSSGGKCQKISNSISLIENQENPCSTIDYVEVLSLSAKTDQDIDTFIKEKMGKGCSFVSKKLSSQSGVYDIEWIGDGKSLDETECLPVAPDYVKYYPSENKIMFGEIGQHDCNLGSAAGGCYDEELINSFLFE